MKVSDTLTLAAARLASGAARDWDEFLAALRAYRDEQLSLLAQAPPDRVHTMQGRALHAIDLVTKFENCREQAKKIMESKNA